MRTQGTIVSFLLVVSLLINIKSSNAMEKKNIEKTTVLKYTLTTTLATLTTDPGEVPMEIGTKAQELGLEVLGPQIWQYTGVDGNPNTKFKLEICLPVKEAKGDAGKFSFDVLPAITCISAIHKGSWSKLGDTYQRVMGEMTRKGIIPTDSSREVYHAYDLEDDSKNVTEIQLIIQQ